MPVILLVSFLAVSAAWGTQEPTAPASPAVPALEQKKEPAKLEGRVVNAVTGEPVRKVTLTLRSTTFIPGSTGVSTTSDTEGRFSFENVEPGTYLLSGQRPGFVRQSYGAKSTFSSGTPLSVSVGQHLKDLDLKLTPQGVITGKVLDEEGEPVAHSYVRAALQRQFGGQTQTLGGNETESNDLGEFRIADLSPGRYILQAGPGYDVVQPAAPKAGEPEETLLPTFYPSATEISGASPVAVTAGQEVTGINITLHKGRVFRVSGKVATPPGTGRIRVSLYPRQQPGEMMMFSSGSPGGMPKPDGSFELLRVRPGSYYLLAMLYSPDGRPQPFVGARVPVDVTESNVTGVVVFLREGLTISGTIRVEGQEKSDLQTARVSLRPVERVPGGNSVAINRDGTFKLEGVSPERFYVNVFNLPDGTYLRSIRMGSQEVLDKGLDLTQTEGSVSVDVIVSAKAGVVDGMVKSGDKPASGSSVVLFPDPPRPERSDLRKYATADQNGRFSIKSVAPGEYKLYAFEEMPPGLGILDPDALKPFGSKGVKVTVHESSREQAELVVIKPEDVQPQ